MTARLSDPYRSVFLKPTQLSRAGRTGVYEEARLSELGAKRYCSRNVASENTFRDVVLLAVCDV